MSILTQQTCTDHDHQVILEHTHNMIGYCQSAILKLRQIPKANRTDQIQNQIKYYGWSIAGFKWSLGVAKQCCSACRNVK